MEALLQITDVAFGGKAVGRLEDGRVCFVRDALPSERVQVGITRETKRFVEAELECVVEISPRRVKPPCPYFGVCGGCSYQHTSYDYQIELKTKQVYDALQRLGGIENPPVQEGIPSPLPYGYRNRITVHRQGGKIGFYQRAGRGLVDIEACLLASDAVNAKLTELRNEPFREGARTLREHQERFGFHQINDLVAALLLDVVNEACSTGGECLIDAYCGSGFFAHALASKFQRTIGIEWNPRSVAQARMAAGPNETYLEGDVSECLEQALTMANHATLILDPPAQGVDFHVIELLNRVSIERLLYVSCDPATLARDLKLLKLSYELESVIPFDMFPQTAEIEVLAILRPRH